VNKEKIRTTAESVVGIAKLRNISKVRHPLFEKLERLFTHWIDSHKVWSVALSFMIIQHKALSLLRTSRRRQSKWETREFEFKGSHGWFDRFKKRAYLHSLKLSGESASIFP
jgi:hypothetical protein